jgi:hypothetical protein
VTLVSSHRIHHLLETVSIGEDSTTSCHDVTVELGSASLRNLREGHIESQCGTIRTMLSHGLDDVRDGDDPRRLNDLTTAQSIGVTRTVNPLMVLQGDFGDRPRK